ncbi:Na+/H+ antiporter NhaC family protein [Bacteroides sp.]|uniref:YfcC family protein n=1 Tax=Bacteroides sp. TaxID=29523 RepID=UPI001B4C9EEE|nr:Na+/H+ antiporter NhaC family protein [Bacteroides sp.]MBP6064883.1 AbgT family transporter [Bacteroides sp.]MBP6067385.1 AbgT family transporter [Bacteroides sp.]MBP6935654.1 AbgT family transporter [Bacteroides sp.]MBP8621508.1 AbgT family transporter [Bacteroides sp.]MBP9506835.1 AbgT family transporter [Bacteroides sp.]
MLKRIPHTYTIISSVILICAVLSWIIPAGEYVRQTIEVNGVPRTVIVDHSFHSVPQAPQTWQVFSSLLNGFERQAGIIAFLLIMGGAFQIMNSSRAIDAGIFSFLGFTKGLERYRFIKMLGVNNVVIGLIITLFSLFGAVFGMSEETLAFVIILVPLAISMGYDSITGLCMVYVAAHIGFSGAVLNPFTIGIAQGLSDLPLFSGFEYRMFCWVILTGVLIVCVLKYASVIKKHPEKSPMYHADAYWRKRGEGVSEEISYATTRSAYVVYALVLVALTFFSLYYPQSTFSLGESAVTCYAVPFLSALFALFAGLGLRKSNHFFILTLLAFTILFLIVGVMAHGWYLPEISAIFLAMGVLSGFANSEHPDAIIKQFLDGAKDMLSAALVVALAGGIIQILQDGRIIDPILHSLASLMGETGKFVSLGTMYFIQTLINLIIPSGSAKAALTMPIMAPFSDVIGLSRQATVMAYQFGDGFTNMITPTSAVLMGALGIARIPYQVWVRWFWRILVFFMLLGLLLLIPTVVFTLNGF